jgi:glucose-6-phosphate dehydrogenase assembly protein OpcA
MAAFMSDAFESSANLGIPIAVDAGAIERELTALWESAGESSGIMRSCSCNLLTIVRNRFAAEQFQPILAKVSETHPSRSIVAYPESGESHLQAWIRAQCSIPFSGGPQVCCESITLAAHGKTLGDLPDFLLTLLIPDLPVYLYWRSFKITDQDLIERMVRFSNLLIVDSHQSREDPQNRLRLLQLLADQSAKSAVRDLNWARITAWRDLIAQFFDSKTSRKFVREISEVRIERKISAAGSIPTRTLLLTGWLASSLGWRRILAARSGDKWFSRWASEGHEIHVRFTGNLAVPGRAAGINSVVLKTKSNAEFSVYVDENASCITAVASVGDSRLFHSVPLESLEESSLLNLELSQRGTDVVFKEALAEALELEKSFLGRSA